MSERGRYTWVVAAVLVAVFVCLYPYLDLAGHCEDGGCPEMTQASASSSPDLPATGVLTALAAAGSAAVLAAGTSLSLSERRPEDLRLSPETPPPRL